MKKGQIAHLDGNRNNNSLRNLVFMCFEHHDEFDSRTSQSKGIMKTEVVAYREELSRHFGGWGGPVSSDHLLNFLAFSIDTDMMADAAVRVASSVVFYGEEHAFDVLITDAVDYCDGDLYVPHLIALDHFASWGWLSYAEEERQIRGEMSRVFITAERRPVCNVVAARILERRRERDEDVSGMLRLAEYRGWAEPNERP